jgi:hypothetical protein
MFVHSWSIGYLPQHRVEKLHHALCEHYTSLVHILIVLFDLFECSIAVAVDRISYDRLDPYVTLVVEVIAIVD